MNPSLPRFLVLWAGLAVACSGGGPPQSQASAPPAGEASGAAAAIPGQINGAGATFPNPIYSKWLASVSSSTRPCSSARPTGR